MRLAQTGDQLAYASLLVLLTTVTRKFVRARVGDSSWIDDVVQETLISVPGAERSRVQRVIPLMLGTAWWATLVVLLSWGGAMFSRLLAFPVHLLCIVEIIGFTAVPAWALHDMVRRSAAIHPKWSAALSALAATALGAGATQILCPIDDPAHHLVGHFLPMVVLALGITLATQASVASWRKSHA